MILKEKVGDNEYILDTTKLKDIEFPFYTPYNRSAYYVPSDKSVYLPIKYGFDKGAEKNTEKIVARMSLPNGDEIKAHVEILFDEIKDAMIDAAENNKSLFSELDISKRMRSLAESIYRAAQQQDDNIVMQSCKHTFPTFLFQRGELIAVTNSSEWDLEDEHLSILMKNCAGTFLRAFHKDNDREVSIVILNETGDPKVESLGEVMYVRGNEIKVQKAKNQYPSRNTVLACVNIYREYGKNYMNYFLDKEDERSEENIEFESLFKEG